MFVDAFTRISFIPVKTGDCRPIDHEMYIIIIYIRFRLPARHVRRITAAPEIGYVGVKLLYPDGTVQHGGVICGIGGIAGHAHKHFPRAAPGYYQRLRLVQNLSAVTAACLLVRRTVYDEVGGLNEEDLTVAFNDVDFCLRVREAGYRNVWTPRAQLIHHESRSRGTDDTPKKQARFKREKQHMKQRWGGSLRRDPYNNPNLSHRFEDFSIEV